MRILFKSIINPSLYNIPDTSCDYQSDSLLHGLKSVLTNQELVDYPKVLQMYTTYPQSMGRRFSLYKLLFDDPQVDRTYIDEKIKSHYFDKIVLSIHHSHNGQWNYIKHNVNELLKYYSGNDVCCVDGWDRMDLEYELTQICRYFKREIGDGDLTDRLGLYPIQFAIPAEKLRQSLEKELAFAPHIPAMFSWDHPHAKTYKYDNEEDFYHDYQRSMFGYHCRKGGFDTMKGLEVLAGGCMPVWLDQDDCPSETLKFYPKELLSYVRELPGVDWGLIDQSKRVCDTRNIREGGGSIDEDNFDFDSYHELLFDLLEYTKTHLTTKALARRFLETITA